MGGLQAADEVPLDGARQQAGFADELLGVVFAEMDVCRDDFSFSLCCCCGDRLWLVEGQDVVGRLEFGDCYEADLEQYG